MLDSVIGVCHPSRGYDPEMWTGEDRKQRLEAMALCFQCPLLQQCRKKAEEENEQWSVAGGVDWELVYDNLRKQSDGQYREKCPRCFSLIVITEGRFKRHQASKASRRSCPMSGQFFKAVSDGQENVYQW